MHQLILVCLAVSIGTSIGKSINDEASSLLSLDKTNFKAKPNPEDQLFFDSLKQEEKIGLMSLAIYYHDSDISVGHKDSSINFLSDNNIGVPTNGTEIVIPKTIYSHLLNGNVPKSWQKEFTKWLKKEFKLKHDNLERFKETNSFCLPGEIDCPKIENIGGVCCPFG